MQVKSFKKRGRPKSPDPRVNRIVVLLTNLELSAVDRKRDGMSRAEYARTMTLGHS
jgi:hypothetical protein